MEDLFQTMGDDLNPKKNTNKNTTITIGDKYQCANGVVIEVDENTTELGLALLGAKKITFPVS